MKTATGRGLLFLISFSLVVSIFASSGIIGEVQASGPTYTTHSVIRINNNGDLAALKSPGGVTGNGLLGDPYIIKGYDITGIGGACIYIGNTTVYLVISECRLHGNNAGIQLNRTVDVTVSNNICSGNGVYGIRMSVASHSVIEKNTLTSAGKDDMFFQDSNNNIIQNNTSTGSGHCSNWLSNSNNNTFSNNTSSGSFGGCGLQVQSSDYNTVSNNTLAGNGEFGIRLFDSSNHNTVIHNLCTGNTKSGIGMTSTSNNVLSNNICSGNDEYGIAQETSSGNAIYGNELTGNNGASSSFDASHVQAYDDAADHWNSLSYGNFWGDWTTPDADHDGIVDHPYPISGAGAKDYLPTVSCQGPHFELNGPSQAVKGENVTWSFLVRNDGKVTLQDVVVLDPLLNKTWTLGDMASGTSLQWSYQSAVPSYLNINNIAYATATDEYGGRNNVSGSHSVTVLLPPSSPQGLTVTVRDGGAVLNWTAPSTTGAASITDYRIFRGNSSGAEAYLGHTGDGSIRTFNDSGLVNGQTYYYQVSAVSLAGEGVRCSEAAAIPVGPPTAPRDLQATAGNALVDLAWSVPSSDGGAAIDHYIVYQNGVDVMHVTTTSATITGLNNGQIYSLTVSARNSVNSGPQTLAVSATPESPVTVPGVPTGPTAIPGDGQLSISWLAPSSDGGAAIDYYQVYVDGVVVSEHYATTSATVTGLVNDHSYNFTVSAHNSAGSGAQSSIGSATPSPDKTVPGVPTGITVTPGNAQISLSWTVPSSNGGETIDYYLIYFNGVVKTDHYATLPQTFTGLVNGQPYTFAIAAHNSVGTGPLSSAVEATPSPAPTLPGVPTELSAITGNAQVSLSWTAPANNGGAEVDYYIVYQDGIDVAHPIAALMIITGLVDGQSYNFTVAAHTSVGTGEQTLAVAVLPSSKAPVPGIPTGLIAALGDGQVKLSWTAPPGSSGIDYYVVYQDGVDVAHPSGNSTMITGLTGGQNYSFAVSAHNSYGMGNRSSAQTITPTSSNSATSSSGDDGMVYLLGFLALLAAVIAIVLVVRRKKKSQ